LEAPAPTETFGETRARALRKAPDEPLTRSASSNSAFSSKRASSPALRAMPTDCKGKNSPCWIAWIFASKMRDWSILRIGSARVMPAGRADATAPTTTNARSSLSPVGSRAATASLISSWTAAAAKAATVGFRFDVLASSFSCASRRASESLAASSPPPLALIWAIAAASSRRRASRSSVTHASHRVPRWNSLARACARAHRGS
jgi:hypothetical protein